MKKYVEVVYDTDKRPVTEYPDLLAKEICEKFNIKKESKILDNGCGRGDFIKAFYNYGLKCYGTDISDFSNEKIKNIPISKVDLENEKLPFEDNFFDVVFSKSVIEHMRTPDNFIKECYRVLKPGGRIILMTPDWKTTMYIFYDDFTHVQPYTVESVYDLLNMYEFKDTKSQIFYQLPVIWKNPKIIYISKILQLFGPVKKIYKNKFLRWSRELMVLGTGIK